MRTPSRIYLGLGALVIVTVLFLLFRPKASVAPTNTGNQNSSTTVTTGNSNSANTNAAFSGTTFSTTDLPNADQEYDFSATIPNSWEVAYASATRAINIFDPLADGDSAITQSKIFIQFYQKTDFTPPTDTVVVSKTPMMIGKYSAMAYVLNKKAGVVTAGDLPTWHTAKHNQTDIQTGPDTHKLFFSFAQAPDVSDEVFTAVLQSLSFR